MALAHEKVVLAFFGALTSDNPAEAASRLMAEDGIFYGQVGLPGIRGRANVKTWLDMLLPRLAGFRYEVLTIGSTGNKVFFERIERSTLTEEGARPEYPAGTPLELRIAGVGTIDAQRGEIVEWHDYFTLPHLQKHSTIPDGIPGVP